MKGVSPLCIGDPEKLPGHVRCVGGRTANWDFSVFPQCVFSTITIKYAFVWERPLMTSHVFWPFFTYLPCPTL